MQPGLSLTRILVVLAGGAFLLSSLLVRADIDPKYYAVEVSAEVQASPPQIRLVWSPDSNATGYTVSTRTADGSGWTLLASLPGSATDFTDTNVAVGTPYEYQVSKSTSAGYGGFGYVYAGIQVPPIEGRGKVILLVDHLYAADLSLELARLQQDLIGDGWTVLRHDVSRDDTPANLKNIIRADYSADPANTQAVFLFGHVPVPYSGNLNPDGHPNHQGAWPADVYYGDMDGTWTDNSVSNTSAERQANWNVPGDGKFDQSELPSDVELEVGRVDLSNLTCFSNKTPSRSERDLLRQYLNKDHAFRQGQMVLQRRGIICDNFGEKSGEAFAASGWRNFAAFFGADSITAVPGWNYFPTVSSQDYLWSYGDGGGGYYTCDGVGSSDDFANNDIRTVFTMFLGSYFGDWDNESNFLRAPLGSTSCTLAVAWAGRPHWFFHHMALGQTIGYSTRLSQNNRAGGIYSPQNYGTRGIHVALMGDPTLRLHAVVPPSNLNGSASGAGVTLSWTASPDSNLQGYHVYRSDSAAGPFQRLTGANPISATSFSDPTGTSSTVYMVRAIKLEQSGGGTYFNPSEGAFYSASGSLLPDSGGGTAPTVPPAPSGLAASAAVFGQVHLAWSEAGSSALGFKIERRVAAGGYQPLASVAADARSFDDSALAAGTLYSYRVAAFNTAGVSSFSNESSATTIGAAPSPATAQFLTNDQGTQGSWSGRYGAEGFLIAGSSSSSPDYAFVLPSGDGTWVWLQSTPDARALQQPQASDRIAAAWFAASGFSQDIDLRDGKAHRVALYLLDWDHSNRVEKVDVLDASTGSVLSSQSISGFSGGAYLVWNLSGHVVIRATNTSGPNAVASGLFFDAPAAGPSTVDTPVITPGSGSYSGAISVTVTCATAGAELRYTLDGSDPTILSTPYTRALTVSGTITVKAKAFKNGLTDSATATANFSSAPVLSGGARAAFVHEDRTTQGAWTGVYGTDGAEIIGDASGAARLPAYTQVASTGTTQYIWSDSTSDGRALYKVSNQSRIAACWFGDPAFDLDVNFTDGMTHRLALYFLDWDGTGRSQRVDLLDASTGGLVDSRTISDFGAGDYLVWDISGHVKVQITKLAGNNAVLMGLFFSPSATQFGDAGAGTLTAAAPQSGTSDAFQLQLAGQTGNHFLIQASTDLVHWTNLTVVTLAGPVLDWVDPAAAQYPTRYYRAVPAVTDFIPPAGP